LLIASGDHAAPKKLLPSTHSSVAERQASLPTDCAPWSHGCW